MSSATAALSSSSRSIRSMMVFSRPWAAAVITSGCSAIWAEKEASSAMGGKGSGSGVGKGSGRP